MTDGYHMCLIGPSESPYLPMTVSPETFSTVALPFCCFVFLNKRHMVIYILLVDDVTASSAPTR